MLYRPAVAGSGTKTTAAFDFLPRAPSLEAVPTWGHEVYKSYPRWAMWPLFLLSSCQSYVKSAM